MVIDIPFFTQEVIPALNQGLKVSIALIIPASILGFVGGVALGCLRAFGGPWCSRLGNWYTAIIRGVPLLVQLFYIYYALGRIIQVPPMVSAVIAISFCYGAYMGEVFRAGILAIPHGQTEAARSLGFNRVQTMFYVVLPQAWRTIIPPVGNECIAMLKDTALVSVIGMPDLMQRARSFASKSYCYFESYTVVALVYLIITLILSKIVSIIEARLNHYDRKK